MKVENVVAVAMLGVDIPLEKLVSQTDSANYEPEPFSGLVYRTGERGVAALIFSSGKIVCTGTKSVKDAQETVRKVVDRVMKIGVDVPAGYAIDIENITASSRLDARFSLKDVAFSLENAEYDPAKYPGLIYKIPDPAVSVMLFADGKILCSGARSVDDIKHALRQLMAGIRKAGVKA